MAKVENPESKVIDAVTERTTIGVNHRITDRKANFLEGQLYTVSFDIDELGTLKPYYSRAYYHHGRVDVYTNDEMLLTVLGETHKPKSVVSNILESNGIAGLIAIILTCTICYLSVFKQEADRIPDILSNGLSVVLGFYFAKGSSKFD